MVTKCKYRGRRGVLWDALKIDGSLARNIDFEVANFKVHTRKLVGKRRFWSYKVWKLEEVFTKCSFWCFNMSRFESVVFVRRRHVYGGSCKTCPFLGVKPGWNVVLRGRRGTFWHSNLFQNVLKVVFCGRHNAPHTLHSTHSTLDTLHFTLYTLHSTLYTPHFTLRTLYTPHFPLYTLHSTLYTSHSTLHTLHFKLHFTLYTLHSTLYTLHSSLHT